MVLTVFGFGQFVQGVFIHEKGGAVQGGRCPERIDHFVGSHDIVKGSSGLSPEAGGVRCGQAKFFFVPNLGAETDAVWTPEICSDCRLAQTTLTENLFYWINPFHVLSLYLSGGGGLGLFQLSSPQSDTALLPVFDIGLGAVLWPGKHIGFEIETRWFFPAGGGLDGNPASRLETNRWFAAIAIPL